ncbi:MAG: hypothetical protein IJL71_06065 [Oscillospiraceae bacterium]|nr:hypothetical protein [Oscillospiraceae bacterium]
MEAIITKLLTMSVTGSVVILLVLAARLMLRKMPKVFSYALWAVVLFRLICPVSFSTGLSLFGLFDTEQAVTEYTEPVQQTAAAPVVNTPREEIHVSDGTVHEAPEIEVTAKPVREITPETVLTVAWLTGAAGMAGYSLVRYLQLRKKLTEAARLRDNIYLADHIDTAFVLGIVRPEIYIPSAVNETELTHIIAHEEHHIRRFDHVTRLLGYLALCVHWFNPLVWAAFILSGKDMEMSCDEAVIKKLGKGERANYSLSLVSLSAGRRLIADVPIAFAEGDTKRRIINLKNMRKPKTWLSLVLAAACLLFTVACAANPKPAGQPALEEAASVTETAVITEPEEKESIVLVDDVPKDTYDVFEGVTTPYEFFRKVKAEDIDDLNGHLPDYGNTFAFHLYSDEILDNYKQKTAGIFNGIKESEIKVMPEPRALTQADTNNYTNDGIMTVECDKCFIWILYHDDGYAELAFQTPDDAKRDANPDLFGDGKIIWIIENDALNSLFEAEKGKTGPEGPEEITITEEPVTFKGEDVGKYILLTENDRLTVKVFAPDGSGFDLDSYLNHQEVWHSICHELLNTEKVENGTEYVFVITHAVPDIVFHMCPDPLHGCTVTVKA